MEVETPAPLSVAPPTPAIPEEMENVELNQQQPIEQQPFVTSPLNTDKQMLPPGTPAHISNEQVDTEEQVISTYLFVDQFTTFDNILFKLLYKNLNKFKF